MSYICTSCGKETPTSTFHNACECGGLFSLPQDHLPLWQESLIDKSVWSQFRYHAFMNLDGDVWRRVSMGEGMTPIVSYNGNVFLKMDFMMPTLSFKDRGAATLVSHMKAIGVKNAFRTPAATPAWLLPPTAPEAVSPAKFTFPKAPARIRSP